jgi:hypothetical protein
MSFSGNLDQPFFGPLWGKTTTFIFEGRWANLKFAKAVVSLLSHIEDSCSIMDLDALYSSNADVIFSHPKGLMAEKSSILVPLPGSEIESEFPRLFEAQQRVIIIDSLNSLYHLFSQEDTSFRSRKLAFAVASLSYFARTSGKAAVLTMYRREGLTRSGKGRSISGLSDAAATVEFSGDEMTVSSERGLIWPGGRLSTRIP